MPRSCFLIIIVILCIQLRIFAIENESSPSEINYISFSQSHLFYLSKTGNHFGFISRESGQIMSKYELQSHEAIISVQKESNSVILRNARTKVVWFDIASSHLEEINVQIAFKHQQIIDVLKLSEKYYVLTDKDLRVYDIHEQKKGESLKNIISSGRKNEFFKKIFLREKENIEQMLLILIKNGEVCIRTFKKVKKGIDQCYFKVPYEITNIERINNSILLQTNTVNYVISQDTASTYSFEGKITQISGEYIQLASFRTYDMQNQIFLDGLMVQGSTPGHVFWIHLSGTKRLSILYNSVLIKQEVVVTLPRRSWVSPGKASNIYDFLIEFEDNRFELNEIQFNHDNTSKISLKWTNKLLRPIQRTSEL